MGQQARTARAGEEKLFVTELTGRSSGKITLPNYGVSNVSGITAAEMVLAAPVTGIRKTLVATNASSAAMVVRASTGTTVKFNASATQITFNASTLGQCVELIGVNSTQWAITSIYPAASTGAGPTIGSS